MSDTIGIKGEFLRDHRSAERIATWLRGFLADGPRLPYEVELGAGCVAIDWSFWMDTAVVRDIAEMRMVELFDGYRAKCWMLREGD